MRWFKHDTDANADNKLQNVLLDYGLEGYGLYWYCIELIAGRVDKDKFTFELEHDARIIARNTGSTPQKVEEMMRYFVKVGLFENSDGVITCLKLAKRLDKSMTSNPEMRKIIEHLNEVKQLQNHDSVMTPSEVPVIESENVMQDQIRLDQIREEISSPVDDGSQVSQDKKPKTKKLTNINFVEIGDCYNQVFDGLLPMVRSEGLSDKRKRAITKLLGKLSQPTVECFRQYIECFRETAGKFYFGEKGWRADFDYILRLETLEKTREGSITDARNER